VPRSDESESQEDFQPKEQPFTEPPTPIRSGVGGIGFLFGTIVTLIGLFASVLEILSFFASGQGSAILNQLGPDAAASVAAGARDFVRQFETTAQALLIHLLPHLWFQVVAAILVLLGHAAVGAGTLYLIRNRFTVPGVVVVVAVLLFLTISSATVIDVPLSSIGTKSGWNYFVSITEQGASANFLHNGPREVKAIYAMLGVAAFLLALVLMAWWWYREKSGLPIFTAIVVCSVSAGISYARIAPPAPTNEPLPEHTAVQSCSAYITSQIDAQATQLSALILQTRRMDRNVLVKGWISSTPWPGIVADCFEFPRKGASITTFRFLLLYGDAKQIREKGRFLCEIAFVDAEASGAALVFRRLMPLGSYSGRACSDVVGKADLSKEVVPLFDNAMLEAYFTGLNGERIVK